MRASTFTAIASVMLLAAGLLFSAPTQANVIQAVALDGMRMTHFVTGVFEGSGSALGLEAGETYPIEETYNEGGQLRKDNVGGSGVATVATGLEVPQDLVRGAEGNRMYLTSAVARPASAFLFVSALAGVCSNERREGLA